jgi:GH25 family lysozyme M1 (1,4-beta-N-acetylmuramidase)
MENYLDFPVRLIDVSRWQDRQDTPYMPTFDKVKAEGFMGVIVRAGFGLVEDPLYRHYVAEARRVGMVYGMYWYLDYYSHRGTGTTAYEWGVEQAYTCYSLMKNDMGGLPLALDLEESTYGGRLVTSPMEGRTTVKEYNECARAFADTWYKLTGKRVMRYHSPSFLGKLYAWAKPLEWWCAWYNKFITFSDIKAKAAAYGFTGKIRLWQYASDGDINNDGVSDGLALGMETKELDLNVWLGTLEEWSKFCGGSPQVIVPPTEDDIVIPAPTEREETFKIMRVVASSGLNIRYSPAVSGKWLDWAPQGTDMVIQETRVKPGEIWHRIGFNQWCAELYNGQTLMM